MKKWWLILLAIWSQSMMGQGLGSCSFVNSHRIAVNYDHTQLSLTNLNSLHGKNETSESGGKNLSQVAFDLCYPLPVSLALGIQGAMPHNELAAIKTHKYDDLRYLTNSNERRKPSIFSSLSWNFLDAMSLEVGLDYSAQGNGEVDITVSDKAVDSTLDLRLTPTVTPVYGLVGKFSLLETEQRLGLSYRKEQSPKSRVIAGVEVDLGVATLPMDIETQLLPFYTPAQWDIYWSWEQKTSMVTLGYSIAQWSKFKNLDIQLSGSDVLALRENAPKTRAKPDLRDTQTYRIGYSWYHPLTSLSRLSAFHLSALYRESATPNLTKSEPIIDLERYQWSAGLSFDLFSQEIQKTVLDLNYSYHFFPRAHLIQSGESHRISGIGHSIIGGICHHG